MKVRLNPPEQARRDALGAYQILHTSDEAAFEEIVAFASEFCQTPIASINFCTGEKVWPKAYCGTDRLEIDQGDSFCQKVVATGTPLMIGDAQTDPDFADNPFVTASPYIRSYLGVPLVSPDGFVLGTICVLDQQTRIFGQKHLRQLEFLARQVMNLMELKKTASALAATQKELTIQHQNQIDSKKVQRDFLSHLSHEMRTPLNSILGLSEIMSEEGLAPQQQQQLLQNLTTSSKHLIETFNTLLEHSRIESGQIKLNNSLFDLRAFAEETLAPFQVLAANKGLDFSVTIDLPDVSVCQGDQVRLRQIVNNLMNNALKFTDSGSIGFELECSETRAGESLFSFRVTDTGIGIPRHHHRQLFEPYTQVSGDFSKGGSGLGLSICRKIIESMDGQIGFDSEMDKGSTFWFMLPLKTGSLAAVPPKVPNSDLITVPMRALDGHVLLVEDNSLSSAVTMSFLEKSGLDVSSASTLQEAVYLLDTYDFQLILLDLHLGNVLPEVLLKEVRARSAAPIVAISGSEVSRQRNFELEIDDALQKPFSKEALRQKLMAWLLEAKDQSHRIREWEDSLLRLEEQCGSEFLHKTIHSFVERHPAEIQKLHRYLESRQWDKLELGAHSMKSTLATLGLMQLARLCSELEELAASQDQHLIAPLLEQFRSDSRKTYQLLITYVKTEFPACEKAS